HIRIRLDDSKYISRRIRRVRQPADFRDRHLRYTDFAAALLDFLDRLIERRNSNRIQSAGALPFTWTSDTAVDSRLLVIACHNEPVLDRAAFKFLELPAENVLIKRLYRFGIFGVNLKMGYAIHSAILILFAVSILVVAPDPIHREIEVVLVATLRCKIE